MDARAAVGAVDGHTVGLWGSFDFVGLVGLAGFVGFGLAVGFSCVGFPVGQLHLPTRHASPLLQSDALVQGVLHRLQEPLQLAWSSLV